ncbi:MAG: hypothetical protein B5M55_06715 [Desulfococcus sp. 4484_242]|nr:MAG: hypothetical protein B5M55_06715 [Desulfococcus sp. 4484_242]
MAPVQTPLQFEQEAGRFPFPGIQYRLNLRHATFSGKVSIYSTLLRRDQLMAFKQWKNPPKMQIDLKKAYQ